MDETKTVEERLALIEEKLDLIVESLGEILEKVNNISTPGVDYDFIEDEG